MTRRIRLYGISDALAGIEAVFLNAMVDSDESSKRKARSYLYALSEPIEFETSVYGSGSFMPKLERFDHLRVTVWNEPAMYGRPRRLSMHAFGARFTRGGDLEESNDPVYEKYAPIGADPDDMLAEIDLDVRRGHRAFLLESAAHHPVTHTTTYRGLAAGARRSKPRSRRTR